MSHPHPELATPQQLANGGLRITPLGGLGEIGRNMTVFEYDGRLLIVDCGVLFPEEHHPGVDLILPDFDAIRDRLTVYGLFHEIIAWKLRMFVPTDERGIKVLAKVLERYSLQRIAEREGA